MAVGLGGRVSDQIRDAIAAVRRQLLEQRLRLGLGQRSHSGSFAAALNQETELWGGSAKTRSCGGARVKFLQVQASAKTSVIASHFCSARPLVTPSLRVQPGPANSQTMSRAPPAKRRRVSRNGSKASSTPAPRRLAGWETEQAYEEGPRKTKSKALAESRLPIRTEDGWVKQGSLGLADREQDSESFHGFDSDSEDDKESGSLQATVHTEPRKNPRTLILEAKEELAKLADFINENPEEHISSLRAFAEIAASDVTAIKKLVLAAQVAVYKGLIPNYRIRPLSEEAQAVQLSKEVRRRRQFEQTLVSCYQGYVRELAKLVKGSPRSSEDATALATVALGCISQLVTAVPHFNFRGDLLRVLVGKLSTQRVDGGFVRCREAIETLFREDEDGNASLDAARMLTKMMKDRDYRIDESVLNTFLHLRLLSEFTCKASYNSVDKPKDQPSRGKRPKTKQEFRTKRQRKESKEMRVIEKEMKDADATVSHEARENMQSETLKLVFVTYFRILKSRSPKLMGAVLEGLARYAHLINQDFFGDIVEALRELVSGAEARANGLPEDEGDAGGAQQRCISRESLLCVITAFALLQGQDGTKTASALKLDLGFFIAHLYRTLPAVALDADVESSYHLLRLHRHQTQGGDQARVVANKVNVQTTIVLLIRSLSSVLLPQSSLKAVPPVRVAAFCKQLMSVSLHLPEKSGTAMLGLLKQITKAHGRKVSALWHTEERRGDGVFDALEGNVESSNPFASTVWEGELLRLHYCPTIREAVKGLEANVTAFT